MSKTRSGKEYKELKTKIDGKSDEDPTKWGERDDGDGASESDAKVDSNQQSSSSDKTTKNVKDVKGRNKDPKGNIKDNLDTENSKKEFKSSTENPKATGGGGKGEGEGRAGSDSTETANSSKRSVLILYCIFPFAIVLVAGLVAVFAHEAIRPDFLNMGKPEDYKLFDVRLKQMKSLFPNQTDRFWTILKHKGRAHSRDKNPKQPLVIMLGAPPSAHTVIDCLAKKLAWCLDPQVDYSNAITGEKYKQGEGHEIKEILDEKLEELFSKGVRSALVLQLELLPMPSPTLFYKYCDNDDSPYKNAGIIFTVHLPQEIDHSLKPAEADGSVETYLAKVAWVNYTDVDTISALLSRIADTVVLVNSESDDVIHAVCGT